MAKLLRVTLASTFGIALNSASAQNVDSDKYKQQDEGQTMQQRQDTREQDQNTTGAAGGQQDQSGQEQRNNSTGMQPPDDSSTGMQQAPQTGQPDSDQSQYRR